MRDLLTAVEIDTPPGRADALGHLVDRPSRVASAMAETRVHSD
jgi:hypothetical protein